MMIPHHNKMAPWGIFTMKWRGTTCKSAAPSWVFSKTQECAILTRIRIPLLTPALKRKAA